MAFESKGWIRYEKSGCFYGVTYACSDYKCWVF